MERTPCTSPAACLHMVDALSIKLPSKRACKPASAMLNSGGGGYTFGRLLHGKLHCSATPGMMCLLLGPVRDIDMAWLIFCLPFRPFHLSMMSGRSAWLSIGVPELTRHVMLAIGAQVLLPVYLARVPRLHRGVLQEGQVYNVAGEPAIPQSELHASALVLQSSMQISVPDRL